jgi:hypothetical protein
MKSIYVDNKIHSSLKLLASLEKKGLTEIVEECLEQSLRKKLSDLPTEILEKLTMAGGGLDYLLDKREDIYTGDEGEPING